MVDSERADHGGDLFRLVSGGRGDREAAGQPVAESAGHRSVGNTHATRTKPPEIEPLSAGPLAQGGPGLITATTHPVRRVADRGRCAEPPQSPADAARYCIRSHNESRSTTQSDTAPATDRAVRCHFSDVDRFSLPLWLPLHAARGPRRDYPS